MRCFYVFLLLVIEKLFHSGHAIEERFFTHDDRNANVMTGLDQSRTVYIYPGIPVFGRLYRHIGICSHGFITLGVSWCTYRPKLKNVNYNIISAFWSDLDYRGSNAGNVSFSKHLYTDTDVTSVKLFRETEIFAKTYGDVKTFQPTVILIVTWKKANPYPYTSNNNSKEFVSFQLNLFTNGRETFVAFIYQDSKMLWKKGRYDPHIGYSISGHLKAIILGATGNYSYNTYRFDSVIGNTGKRGRWIWKLNTNIKINNREECMKWYEKQPNDDYIKMIRLHSESTCPCLLRQMKLDNRYRYWYGSNDIYCSRQRGIWYFHDTFISFFTVCCYHPQKEYLLYELDHNLGILTQTYITQSYHSSKLWYRYYRSLARAKATSDDSVAFHNCCVKSTLCHLYARKRPVPDCNSKGYSPPIIGWSGGDPHIKTLDGLTYTFNGIGDYNLITLKNSSDFAVHCRMSKAVVKSNITTKESKATVFSAFALSAFQGALVEIYMNVSTGHITLLINKEAYNVSNFNGTKTINGTDISWKNGNRTQLSVVYESGVGAVISIFETLLTIQISSLPSFFNKTIGLFGVYNKNISDDLTRPDGTFLHVNSSQKTIYHEFGKLWRVDGNQSLFTLDNTGFDASYTPLFFDNIDDLFGNNTMLKERAISLCGKKSFTCLFDVMLTGDTKAAAESKSTLEEFDAEQKILVTYPPKILSPKSIVLYYGEKYHSQIVATSKTASNLSYSLEASGVSAEIDSTHGNFSLYVNSTIITIKFLVKDENGLAAVLLPNIRFCYCLNGSCNATEENPFATSPNIYLSYGKCHCKDGFKGKFCQYMDYDYCKDNPCYPGVNCTSNNVTSSAVCGPCPEGYIGNGKACEVINPPIIVSPKSMFLYYGKQYSFKVVASSKTASNLSYSLEATGISAQIDSKNGNFSLYVNSTIFTLKFLVRDENNLFAGLSPNMRLCYCLNGSSCNVTEENPFASSPNVNLSYGKCNCKVGFTGQFCQYKDYDYCKHNRCYPGVNCTNNNATSNADCGPCPEGYFGDGKACKVMKPTTKEKKMSTYKYVLVAAGGLGGILLTALIVCVAYKKTKTVAKSRKIFVTSSEMNCGFQGEEHYRENQAGIEMDAKNIIEK